MRIIHFSDFHLGVTDGSRSLAKERVAPLLDAFTEIADADGKAIDLVIFSGDMVNKGGNGHKNGIKGAFADFKEIVIDKVVDRLGISPDRFIFVPGNHDIERYALNDKDKVALGDDNDKIRKFADEREVSLQQRYMSEGNIDMTIADNELEPRVAEFKSFEHAYYDKAANSTYQHTNFESSIIFDLGQHQVGVVMLNSVWRCYDSHKDEKRIVMGRLQLTRRLEELKKCDLLLAVSHHHHDCLAVFDSAKVKMYLFSNYDMLLYGHTHLAKSQIVYQHHGEMFESGIGSQAPENNGNHLDFFKNDFAVIDYDFDFGRIDFRHYVQREDGSYKPDPDFATKNNGVMSRKLRESNFIGLNEWLNIYNNKYRDRLEYLCNDRMRDIQGQLLHTSGHIELVALAGFGKTRLIFETFYSADNKLKDKAWYCDVKNMEFPLSGFADRVSKNEDATFILDNCPHDTIRDIIDAVGNRTRARIIAVNSDYFAVSSTPTGFTRLAIEHDILKEEVDDYIRRNLQQRDPQDKVVNDIIIMSDGFPAMAQRFVESYRTATRIDMSDTGDIIRRIVHFDAEHKDEERALVTMSLFSPMPYGIHKNAYEFILNNKVLNPVSERLSKRECRGLFNKVIRTYSPELIEISDSSLRVRPVPLAIILTEQWLMEQDEETFGELKASLDNFRDVSEDDYNLIVSTLCRRFANMRDNPYAVELIQRITEGTGPFGNEKAVCSDIGSRLFLAMASVNPVAVGTAIWRVLSTMPLPEIRSVIAGDVRRYMVRTLIRVCYDAPGFSLGLRGMLRLSLAENEQCSNNATGEARQLFHFLLSGTRADLSTRIRALEEVSAMGQEYNQVVLGCLEYALHNGQFMRMSGGEPLGMSADDDYKPKDWGEVYAYWNAAIDLIIEILDENHEMASLVRVIVEKSASQWITGGRLNTTLLPLYRAVKSVDTSEWDNLYYGLSRSRLIWHKSHVWGSNEVATFLSEIRPPYFVTDVIDLINNFQLSKRNGREMNYDELLADFDSLVHRFVADGLYNDYTEVEQLFTKLTIGDYGLAGKLVEALSEDTLKAVLGIIKDCITNDDVFMSNGFFRSFCSRCKFQYMEDFYGWLIYTGRQKAYIRLLSSAETPALNSLHRLEADAVTRRIDGDYISDYLANVAVLDSDHIKAIISELLSRDDASVDDIMDFAQRFIFAINTERDPDAVALLKRLCLLYVPTADKAHANLNLYELSETLLRMGHDADFAVKICHKVIEAMKSELFHDGLKNIFSVLLEHYAVDVWPELSRILYDDSLHLTYLQVNDELGSGYTFAEGPLFRHIPAEYIRSLCIEHQDTAPHNIAYMVPVFECDNTKFSTWVYWLLDNFGSNESVLSNIGANVGTYSWTGDIKPLYEKQKGCFAPLLNHRIPQVQQWAKEHIDRIDKYIKYEVNRESRLHMRY